MILENGLTLAYIGDAIYEVKIREYLIEKFNSNVNEMHNEAIKYTSAKAQSYIIENIMDMLTEEEIRYFKRGRNGKTNHKPKSCTLNEYLKATGFEALIGYLYFIKNEERLNEIIRKSIVLINQKNG